MKEVVGPAKPSQPVPDKDEVIRFGSLEVDLRAGELRRAGLKVKLSGQPFDVLVALLEKPGQVVTREELHEKLWAQDTFVDFEHGLNKAINRVREALGDDADNPRFVETLPRRGYRFVAPVMRPVPVHQPPSERLDDRRRAGRRSPSYLWTGVAAVCILAALLAVFIMRRSAGSPYGNLNVVPLTSYPGAELFPSFSPDGNEVVFAWNGGESGTDLDLYRKQVGSEKAVRLTTIHADVIAPAWSPDGRHIAYIRVGSDSSGLYLIPSLGGPERKLSDVSGAAWAVPSLSWSPDGKWLAFPGPGPSSKDYDFAPPSQIHLLNIETLEDRILPYPSAACTFAVAPAFSAAGNQVVSYCAEEAFTVGVIYIQSVQGQAIRKFAQIKGLFSGLTWSPDGKSIVYSLNNCLWRQALVEGPPEKLPFGQDASAPTFARVGDRLAFVRANMGPVGNLNIWRLDLSSPTRPNGIPVRVITSNRGQEEAQISPDGKRIAFVSERSGNPEIWVADSDGSNVVQLTSLGAPFTGTPSWGPDSRRIVFDSRVADHAELYTIDAGGGPPRHLQTGTPDAFSPYWSRDGRWIYFSVSIGKTGIWKAPAEGGVAIQLTTDRANLPQEARDTKRILYLRDEPNSPHSCIGSVSVNGMDGHREYCVELKPPTFFGDEWTPGPKGVYFLTNKTNPVSLNLLNLSSGKIQHVADVPGRLPDWGSEPSLSADGHILVFATADPMEGDLMLVQGFH